MILGHKLGDGGMMGFKQTFYSIVGLFIGFAACAFSQQVGEELPAWKPGTMDLHHISTGRGNASFFILPDGTTMLLDAGAMDATDPRTNSPRTTRAVPDSSRTPGEWVSRYIGHVLQSIDHSEIDYAVLTHFHDDHMGSINALCKTSSNGAYKLSGLTEVGDRIRIRNMLDRGWPDYDYPKPMNNSMVENYRAFIKWQAENRKLKPGRFQPGRHDQIVLQYDPKGYTEFEIRNLSANGEVWTGVGDNTRKRFPAISDLALMDRPSENDCSIALRISYGPFDYFTGGDIGGGLQPGAPDWLDLETPVAQVVGPVEVNVLNHHGNKSSENAFFVHTLRPRVHIIQVWSSDHPADTVLERLLSMRLYPGPRDIFATSMTEANKLVIGENLAKLCSDQGHVVVRVDQDGKSYKVIIVDDSNEKMAVKGVFGPYPCN
jgi:beta-lactamase superfamily II metal-dependent hydrolase